MTMLMIIGLYLIIGLGIASISTLTLGIGNEMALLVVIGWPLLSSMFMAFILFEVVVSVSDRYFNYVRNAGRDLN